MYVKEKVKHNALRRGEVKGTQSNLTEMRMGGWGHAHSVRFDDFDCGIDDFSVWRVLGKQNK